ncbi:MAG: DUF3303 domain-containing protein [Methanolinea sp.]|nr:DUF3303 domain-containing protein [Methanolinea sp.]
MQMLFMSTFQWEPGRTEEVMQAKMKEQIPKGIKVVREWVALDVNRVYRLIEIDDPAALLQSGMIWADLGYTEMHPVMDAKDAMKLLG